jgi:hypothetical protein
MTVKGKIFSLCFFSILLLGVCVALLFRFTRKTIVLTTESLAAYTIYLSEDSVEKENERREYNRPDALESASELILFATPTGSRRMKEGYVESQVVVNRVVKGNMSIEGDRLSVLEPASFHDTKKGGRWYSGQPHYAIMMAEREYLLFLSLREFPEGYKRTADDMSYLIKGGCWGKYAAEKWPEPSLDVLQAGVSCTYADLMYAEIITTNDEIMTEYLEWKNYFLTRW